MHNFMQKVNSLVNEYNEKLAEFGVIVDMTRKYSYKAEFLGKMRIT